MKTLIPSYAGENRVSSSDKDGIENSNDRSINMSNKIIYIGFVTATLILIAPYIWLILDILDRNSYDKILIDACLSGPCLILTVLIWCFAVKLEKLKKQKNN